MSGCQTWSIVRSVPGTMQEDLAAAPPAADTAAAATAAAATIRRARNTSTVSASPGSSVGQSDGLLSRGSQVRVLPGASPKSPANRLLRPSPDRAPWTNFQIGQRCRATARAVWASQSPRAWRSGLAHPRIWKLRPVQARGARMDQPTQELQLVAASAAVTAAGVGQ